MIINHQRFHVTINANQGLIIKHIKIPTLMEDLQKQLDEIMFEQNNRGIPEFEGFSPHEMLYILYDTFGENSPIKLQILSKEDYTSIPLLNQIKYIASLIAKNGEIKLTAKGFLPTKFVIEIYNQKYMPYKYIESGLLKLYKEIDSPTVYISRILMELAGLTKKRKGKLSLTKIGEKIMSNNHELLKIVFVTFGRKINWAYFDLYGHNNIGPLGFGFSLILLSKYGSLKKLDKYYAKKYFKAFPNLIINMEFSFENNIRVSTNCYSLRTFERLLDYFGLIKIESEGKWESDIFITKTKLFDKYILVNPPTTA